MIDYFSLGLTHGLMLLMAWRMLFRADLDREDPPKQDEQSSSWGGKK